MTAFYSTQDTHKCKGKSLTPHLRIPARAIAALTAE